MVAFEEASAIVAKIHVAETQAYVTDLLGKLQHRFPQILSRINIDDVGKWALSQTKTALQWIVSQGAGFSVSVVNTLLNFFLMLFMMFYFFIDGERILARLIRWSPLRDEHERLLLHQFLRVSKATLKGLLVIGVVQGTIGALLFLCLGLDSPVLLGTLMIFASIIPAVGVGLIWVPVAIWMLIQGKIISAIIIAAVCALIIGTVDNVLRPILVGKDTELHDIMVLVSTLGGLGLFGLPGFILGPVIASLFVTLWTLYEQVFADELLRNSTPLICENTSNLPASENSAG